MCVYRYNNVLSEYSDGVEYGILIIGFPLKKKNDIIKNIFRNYITPKTCYYDSIGFAVS